jgi:hypothetical protein
MDKLTLFGLFAVTTMVVYFGLSSEGINSTRSALLIQSVFRLSHTTEFSGYAGFHPICRQINQCYQLFKTSNVVCDMPIIPPNAAPAAVADSTNASLDGLNEG